MYDKNRFFIENRKKLTDKKYVISIFAVTSNLPYFEVDEDTINDNAVIVSIKEFPEIEKSDVVKLKIKNDFYYSFIFDIIPDDKTAIVKIIESFEDNALFKFSDVFNIKPGDIENYTQPTVMKTSYGRFFLNYVWLVFPFGDKIEYMNKIIKVSEIENIVTEKLLSGEIKIDPEYKRYMLALYTYGHFPEICVPTASLKSLTTSPEVKKRRKELIEENKDRLTDPIVAKNINNELIALDKQWLEGDPSKRFYDAKGSSSWNVKRAKMVVNVGGVPAFTDEVGKINYIPGALVDGWDKNNFDSIVNEVYKGSYFRGVETQLGGEQTNIILRMFQGSKITDEDCGTKDGLSFYITEQNVSDFYGMYQAVTDKIISKENKKDFINKKIIIRSPITCKSPGSHFCIKCFGELYRKRDSKSIELDAVYFSSTIMLLSMKNMHGTEIKTVKLDMSKYLVSNF